MIKNIPHSIQTKLLNLSRNSGIAYQQIITRYFQERLLFRLSKSRYRKNFILKGGALLYAQSGEVARPTLDLDFLGEKINREQHTLGPAFSAICAIEDEDGVLFVDGTMTLEEITVDKKYPGLRISIQATLGNIRQFISMDIGFGDIIVPAPVKLDYPTLLDNSSIQILAYSTETVIAEKLQTMADRYLLNSRMKDFFDVYTLLKQGGISGPVLREAIMTTFTNRGTESGKLFDVFNERFTGDSAINQRWGSFRKKLQRTLPDFPEIMREIEEALKEFEIL